MQGTVSVGNSLNAKAASITRQAILEVTEQKACSPNEDAQVPWFIKSISKLRVRSNGKEMGHMNTQDRVQAGWECQASCILGFYVLPPSAAAHSVDVSTRNEV